MAVNNILKRIRIVLIQTSHPGNIGSAARAMKTMGLTDLCLVKPKYFPDEQANTMSSNAQDILEQAQVVDTVQEAIADCKLVIGSSARHERSLAWDILEPRICGERVATAANNNAKVALLFGRESSGLTNDELALCHHLVHVPTNPEYSSLNVASAVQIMSYECRQSVLQLAEKETKVESNEKNKTEDVVSASAMESYYQQLETAMVDSDFLDPDNPRHLMNRIRRLYGRVGVTQSELNILRGMLVAFQKRK